MKPTVRTLRAIIIWVCCVSLCLGLLSMGAAAQSGAPADPRLQKVLNVLNSHPELRDNLITYAQLSGEFEELRSIAEPLLEVLNELEALKALNIPLVGSAWDALCTGLKVSGANVCPQFESLRESLLEIQGVLDRIQGWQRLRETVDAMDALQDSPDDAHLQAFLTSAGQAQEILVQGQKDLATLEKVIGKVTSITGNIRSALRGFAGLPILEEIVTELDSAISEVDEPLRTLQGNLAELRSLMQSDARTLQAITGRSVGGFDGNMTPIIIALAVLAAGILLWVVLSRRKPAPALAPAPAQPSYSAPPSAPSGAMSPASPPAGPALVPPVPVTTAVRLGRLTILSGPLQGMTVPLAKDNIAIGRGRGNDLSIPDGQVSRLHCRLRYGQGAWYIQDQGSTNGTYVNGRRVTATRLQNGDRIRVGKTDILFEYPS